MCSWVPCGQHASRRGLQEQSCCTFASRSVTTPTALSFPYSDLDAVPVHRTTAVALVLPPPLQGQLASEQGLQKVGSGGGVVPTHHAPGAVLSHCDLINASVFCSRQLQPIKWAFSFVRKLRGVGCGGMRWVLSTTPLTRAMANCRPCLKQYTSAKHAVK